MPDDNLKSARTIVAVGAGVKTEAAMVLVRQLAECLGAPIAGTRPAVDRGFISPGQMIGQTGLTVQPEIYIAIGISGASQHQTGMGESAKIVAVNSDPSAPIFSVAECAIVGELEQVIPRMIDACQDGATIEQIVQSSSTGS